MTLHIIGIGLTDEKDISVKGLEIVKRCSTVYIENYTSLLQCSLHDLAKYYGKELIVADRNTSEQGDEEIVLEAKEKEVAFLVIGDALSATTHIDLYKLAQEKNVPVHVIHNASVLTAVGVTGLQLYKFGKTTSIPFLEDFPQLESPYTLIKENKEKGAHTLCLLDIKKDQERFMTVNKALEVLEDIEKRREEKLIHDDLVVVGCARLGSSTQVIRSGKIKDMKCFDFGSAPHCLIIPGKLHFIEEEMLALWR